VKDLGIPMGIPYFEVKELCTKHNITLFSTNLTLYRDISARVMSALKSEFDICEVYSVDEAFFIVEDSVREEDLAQIRSRIMQKTGIPVSIGIAATKTRAKIASKIAKGRNVRRPTSIMSGVCIMDDVLWREVSEDLSCGSVWGIGRQTSAFLSKSKINTVSELLAQDQTFIKQSLGVVGERLCMELNGVSVYAVGESMESEQGSYMSTRSFSKPITADKATILSALGYHVAHLAEKLRNDACVASKITIIVEGSRFGSFSHRSGTCTHHLLVPTNDTITLTKEVVALLEVLYDSEIPYKKAGVILGGIMPEAFTSASLFGEQENNQETPNLNSITDSLNNRFGSGTIRSGVTLNTEKWQEQRKLKSQRYTTEWSEIASVKAI
jgi:DNA polymerase V